MILVDTTVWIDFFADRPAAHVQRLEEALVAGEDLCVCGVVLAEVLQGIRSDRDYRRTKSLFDTFLYLPADRSTFLRSADIYRLLRKKGTTIRKSVDCLIAATAIEHKVPLLHNDRDFDPMAKHCGLKVVEFPSVKSKFPTKNKP